MEAAIALAAAFRIPSPLALEKLKNGMPFSRFFLGESLYFAAVGKTQFPSFSQSGLCGDWEGLLSGHYSLSIDLFNHRIDNS